MKPKGKDIALIVALCVTAAAGIFVYLNRDYLKVIPIGCAYKAKALCAGLFVQGLPRQTIEAEDANFDPAFALMRASVDEKKKSVTCSLLGLGLFARTAMYFEGLGPVLLVHSGDEARLRAMALPPPAPPATNTAGLPWPRGEAALPLSISLYRRALDAAVDLAFAEPSASHLKRTRAVIVVHGGHIVAERYAKGIGADTRLLSWSIAKSFTNALVGILVRQGRLDIHKPAPVPVWRGAGDPRGAITTDMLLRMSSGLAWYEEYADHPINDVNQMLFAEPDAAAYAAAKSLAFKPDTRWSYSTGTTSIVMRIARDVIGSESDYLAFPRRELFDKIGMRSALFGSDASGNLLGAAYLYATARDYARFGLLCLHDGVWIGERILPERWMSYSTTPTPASPKGSYGAFFWLNRGSPGNPLDRDFPGMPTDLFYADGYQGQEIFVCPSLDLVAVRLGMTYDSNWDSAVFLAAIREALGPGA